MGSSKNEALRNVYINGTIFGYFDGEYVFDGYPKLGKKIWRIDGEEVYTAGVPAKLVAYLNENVALRVNSTEELFQIEEEIKKKVKR